MDVLNRVVNKSEEETFGSHNGEMSPWRWTERMTMMMMMIEWTGRKTNKNVSDVGGKTIKQCR